MSVQPGPRATHRAADARGAGRPVRRGGRRRCAGRGAAGGAAVRMGAAARRALHPVGLGQRQEPRAGHAAQQRLPGRAVGRHRGAGQCREQHGAPVRGGRQRRAVSHRLDPQRRAAALRRAGGAADGTRADRQAGHRTADPRRAGSAARPGPVREHHHRGRCQLGRAGQGPGAAGAARTAAAAGHRRCRLCRRHRLSADAGAHPPAHSRYALVHAQQAAARPGPEPVDRRPDVAPAGGWLAQPAGRPGREADHQRRDALLLVRPGRAHTRHAAHLALGLRRIHARAAADLGRRQRQPGAVGQLPLDLARRR